MQVLNQCGLPISIIFKAERSIICRAFTEERVFTASVELTENVVTLVLDDSEYFFTAQQCGELADSLATLVRTSTKRAAGKVSTELPIDLDFCKILHQLILSRSRSTRDDRLHRYEYDSESMTFGAYGSFQYPGTGNLYKLFVGFNDELCLPFLGIEDWVYTFSFDEAFWLSEQLCMAGYLLAGIEQPEEQSKKKGRNN